MQDKILAIKNGKKMMEEKSGETLVMPRHGSACQELRTVRSDILARGIHIGQISGAYRFRKSFLDLLAAKYGANLDNYEEEEDEDCLLLGQSECEKALEQPSGQGMEKVAVFLAAEEKRPANIQAILLLEADFSDENRQKFLIRTRKRIYLRDASLALQSWPAHSVSFGNAGFSVHGKPFLAGLPIDGQFRDWHKELLLLEAPLIKNSLGWHPFAGLLTKLGMDGVPGAALPYMQFLCAIAGRSNSLAAADVLYLESLGAEFGLREEIFSGLFENPKTGRQSSARLQKMLQKAKECVCGLAPHVLYLDALEMAHDRNGECRCPEIVEILRSDEWAGPEFTDNICGSIKHERKGRQMRVAAGVNLPQATGLDEQHFYLDSLNFNILNYKGKLDGRNQ